MTGFRHWYGVIVFAFGSGALLYWVSIHPFIDFWRRRGVAMSLAVNWIVVSMLAAVVIWQHERVMFGDLGLHWLTAGPGVLFLAASAVLRRSQARVFTTATLVGLPELDPGRADNLLVTSGIYGRLRHPRYLQLWLGFLGHALIVNYLSVYSVLIFLTVVIAWIVRLEERELVARFGDAYRDYSTRVPRFVPRI